MVDASESLTALQKIASEQSSPATRFNTDLVRTAFNAIQRQRREARRALLKSNGEIGEYGSPMAEDPLCYAWIEQLWTDHVIVRLEDASQYLRIPYTVSAPGTTTENVKFGKPEAVQQAYVAASAVRGQEAIDQILELRNVSPKERDSLKSKGHTLPGTTSYPIKSLKDLSNAIQAYGRSKPEDRSRLKSHLMSEAKRLGASQAVLDRIKALGQSSSDSVKTTAVPEGVLALASSIALAQVRTMAGTARYKKPIGSQLGAGGGYAPPVNPAKGVTKAKPDDKKPQGKSVFGDLKDEKSLKSAIASVGSMQGANAGKAAAEVVKAAQQLGLTAMVPANVKRLYREFIAQSTIKSPSKAPAVTAKKGA
jgi:hypothetical protein